MTIVKRAMFLPSPASLIATVLLAGAISGGCVIGSADAQEPAAAPAPAETKLEVFPVEHASFAMTIGGETLYVDPVGGAARYSKLPKPRLILITDIHPDHLSVDTLMGLVNSEVNVVAPAAVAAKLPEGLRIRTTAIDNGQTLLTSGLEIHAMPMYNLTQDRLQYHDKGRGNGYIVQFGGKRVYISGDTEDIPEMRALRDIDIAFVCMNLPYTMTVEQAASAVREFKPKVVYPYHYRGSDVQKFKDLVGSDAGVEVRMLDWYPQSK